MMFAFAAKVESVKKPLVDLFLKSKFLVDARFIKNYPPTNHQRYAFKNPLTDTTLALQHKHIVRSEMFCS